MAADLLRALVLERRVWLDEAYNTATKQMDPRNERRAPEVETRWVFISANRQIQLAVSVASYFRDSDKYVAFFEFPSVEYEYMGTADFGTDGYFARVIGERIATQIGNALARVQPREIVLLGMNDIEKGYLVARFPKKILFESESAAEVADHLRLDGTFTGDIHCRPSEAIRGLLKARREQKRIVYDERAESLPSTQFGHGRGLIAIEEDGDLHDLAAINLAQACGLDVVLLPPVTRDDLRSLPHDLRDWSKDHSHHAFQSWKRWVRLSMEGIDLSRYEFATFFTNGLPYGLFVRNSIPCSHVLKSLGSGLAILNAISQEHAPDQFGSALLFSPQVFQSEETSEIQKLLLGDGFRSKLLLGREATVKNIDNFGAYYPYDVFHICSHGGETEGYLTSQSFRDRNGDGHSAEYYEVVGFGPIEDGQVVVRSKLIYHKLDGHLWNSSALKSFPSYVFEDLMKAIKSDETDGVVRVPTRAPIAFSCHIQCHSSIHQGEFQQLSGFGNPVVFNNSCSSSRELAVSFISAGARCYIGTLWKIGNETASEAAVRFYKAVLAQRNLLEGFHKMVMAINDPKYRDVYLFWGFHFSELKRPADAEGLALFAALMFTWRLYFKKITTTQDAEVKRNLLPVLRFLRDQILFDLQQRGFPAPPEFDEGAG